MPLGLLKFGRAMQAEREKRIGRPAQCLGSKRRLIKHGQAAAVQVAQRAEQDRALGCAHVLQLIGHHDQIEAAQAGERGAGIKCGQ